MSNVSKSPWVIHYDGSSCNGCDIEVLAALSPLYDAERFGVRAHGRTRSTPTLLLVTGAVNAQNTEVLREIYDQMTEPKGVVACGICACSVRRFPRLLDNVVGGVDQAIPVDVYAPGCAIRPENSIIDAVVEGIGVLEEKRAKLAEARRGA